LFGVDPDTGFHDYFSGVLQVPPCRLGLRIALQRSTPTPPLLAPWPSRCVTAGIGSVDGMN
jgi:hypothetical protein